MKKPRWIERVRAFVKGNFWLPCPVCGEDFGGHEAGEKRLYLSRHYAMLTCQKDSCQERAQRSAAALPPPEPYVLCAGGRIYPVSLGAGTGRIMATFLHRDG